MGADESNQWGLWLTTREIFVFHGWKGAHQCDQGKNTTTCVISGLAFFSGMFNFIGFVFRQLWLQNCDVSIQAS